MIACLLLRNPSLVSNSVRWPLILRFLSDKRGYISKSGHFIFAFTFLTMSSTCEIRILHTVDRQETVKSRSILDFFKIAVSHTEDFQAL